jgi:hypothetical protein
MGFLVEYGTSEEQDDERPTAMKGGAEKRMRHGSESPEGCLGLAPNAGLRDVSPCLERKEEV